MTESTMFGEQSRRNSSQLGCFATSTKNSRQQLADAPWACYTDSDMPEDLRSGPGVTLVSMFGNSSRFTGVDPRCVLFADASLSAGTFQMRPNCMEQSGRSIVQQMNDLIAKGVVITTGLEEGVGRCSISRPIAIDTSTGVATIKVDDPQCRPGE